MSTSQKTNRSERIVQPVLRSILDPRALGVPRQVEADERIQARIDWLADRHADGGLSETERQENEAYIDANNFFATLYGQIRQMGGDAGSIPDDDPDNLALACPDSDLHKGTNLSGLVGEPPTLQRLFHPRRDAWEDHLEWRGILIFGKTDVGSVTIDVLQLNTEDRLRVRRAWQS